MSDHPRKAALSTNIPAGFDAPDLTSRTPPRYRRETNSEPAPDQGDSWPFGEMSAQTIAQVMHASIVTARRWRRERYLPRSLRPLARLLLRGDLSVISPVWSGWSLRHGELHSPYYGQPFTVADMEYYSVLTGRANSLERRVQHLEAENQALRDAIRANSELCPAQRAEQRATLKAIGGAELLQAMALTLSAGLQEATNGAPDVQTAVRAAAELVRDLYQQIDPATGEPFCVNSTPHSPAEEGARRRPALRLAASSRRPADVADPQEPPAA